VWSVAPRAYTLGVRVQTAAAGNKPPAVAAARAHAGDDGGGVPGRQGGIDRLRAGARRRRNAAGAAAAVDTREQAGESSEDEAEGDGAAAREGADERERGGAQPAVSGKVAREERRQEKERLKDAQRDQQDRKVRCSLRTCCCAFRQQTARPGTARCVHPTRAAAALRRTPLCRLLPSLTTPNVPRQAQEELAAVRVAADAAEAADFEKWRDQIAVESGGTAAEELASESQGLLAAFVEHVKARKLVVLEELAAEFGLRTAEAVSRVQALESMGRLTGVMDDRGKFIYISPEEMATVAAFINAQGRVSIAELASRSNDFIRLAAPVADNATME
jgi:hypothetical protein